MGQKGPKRHSNFINERMIFVTIFEKDMKNLDALMQDETICWGEITRLARDDDGQEYMVTSLPAMSQRGISGGERCVIYASEADADTNRPRLMNLMGRRVPFVVTAAEPENDRLIASRKKAQQALKLVMMQDLANGRIYEGAVTGFSRFGAYIEVNGVTGHLRNSDFSSDHSDVREYLSVGDSIEVKCKEFSKEGYIYWEVMSKVHRTKPISHDFEPDTVVLGRVVRINQFQRGVGVFVNLQTGIDALCSLPREIEVEEGARVSVKIETVTPGAKPTDTPRIRGRIVRVC